LTTLPLWGATNGSFKEITFLDHLFNLIQPIYPEKYMSIIQRIGPKLDSVEVAQKILEDLSKLKGYITGLVDKEEIRCVYYMKRTKV
jgi:hypothetical protein